MILTAENYFSKDAQMQYFGVSQFKSFENCEVSALEEITGNYERAKTTALLVGSYVDAHFEGTLDIFKAQHPELLKRDGTLKSDYVRAEALSTELKVIRS